MFSFQSMNEYRQLIMHPSDCLRNYSSAGFLVTTPGMKEVLLGTHHEAPGLWGNFAGGRLAEECDPRITAARELQEEIGLGVDPETNWSQPLIVIVNYRMANRRPSIGIIYKLEVEKSIGIDIPPTSEIKNVEWFSCTMPLMDEANPAERLWGGVYTAEALRAWEKRQFGGVVQVNSWYGGLTLYDRLKIREAEHR